VRIGLWLVVTMATKKAKKPLEARYREGTLGWWLVNAGYIPCDEWRCADCGSLNVCAPRKEQVCAWCRTHFDEAHTLWRRNEESTVMLTGWEARREVLIAIYREMREGH
jgi:hypothetical protein